MEPWPHDVPPRLPSRRVVARALLRLGLALLVAVALCGVLLSPGLFGGDGVESGEGGNPVVIFTRAGCPYCMRAKALLRKRGVSFAVVDLDLEPRRRAQAAELSGAATVPQVFVGRRSLGGYEDIRRLDEAGQLLPALELRESDGLAISPTPGKLLARRRVAVPERAVAALAPKAARLRTLKYDAGSRPSLRAFFTYALTGRPAQGQQGNVPLNLVALPGEKELPWALPRVGALELVGLLRLAMARLLDSFADPLSGEVDYAEMRTSTDWVVFLALASELANQRLQQEMRFLDENARKAFLINLYNAMVFHGVVRYGRRPGLWNLYCFFVAPSVSYSVAGFPLSLDDVENGLLRARPGYFREGGDEFLRRLRLFKVDPRVHMALNCGARGCPPVAVYSAENLDEELDGAAKAFVADDHNVRVVKVGRRSLVSLSSLFHMYIEDFVGPLGQRGSQEIARALVHWVAGYARGEKFVLLSSMLEPGAPPIRIKWLKYDWSTNGPDLPLDKRIYTPVW